MTLDANTNHYILTTTDVLNNLGYDITERAMVIGATNSTRKANRFLYNLSSQVYGLIELRQEKDKLVQKFNADTNFVLDILLLQFEFWEASDVDLFQSVVKGVCPLVEEKLRAKGLLFEGKLF